MAFIPLIWTNAKRAFGVDLGNALMAFIPLIWTNAKRAFGVDLGECLNGIHTRGMPNGIHTVDFLIYRSRPGGRSYKKKIGLRKPSHDGISSNFSKVDTYGLSKFHVLQIVKVGQDKKRPKRSKKKSEIRVTFLILTGCKTSQ